MAGSGAQRGRANLKHAAAPLLAPLRVAPLALPWLCCLPHEDATCGRSSRRAPGSLQLWARPATRPSVAAPCRPSRCATWCRSWSRAPSPRQPTRACCRSVRGWGEGGGGAVPRSGGAHGAPCLARCHTSHAGALSSRAAHAGHDASVRASASVEDVASTIEAVLMNNDTEEITEAVVAKVVVELVRAARAHTRHRRPAAHLTSPARTEQAAGAAHRGEVRDAPGADAGAPV